MKAHFILIRPAEGGAPFVAPPQSGLGAKKGPLCTFLLLPLLFLVAIAGPARADEDDLADVVAGVIKPRGTTILAGNVAVSDDDTIIKAGNTYITKDDIIVKAGNAYVGSRGTVIRAGNTFIGDRDVTVKAGNAYIDSRGTSVRAGSALIGSDK